MEMAALRSVCVVIRGHLLNLCVSLSLMDVSRDCVCVYTLALVEVETNFSRWLHDYHKHNAFRVGHSGFHC